MRVLDKATPEQVIGLARNLPLTHSVPGKAPEDATPGQLGFLANLFEKENASQPNPNGGGCSNRPGSPEQDPGGIRPGAWPRSPPTGDANSWKAWNSSTGRGPRALRRRRLRQDPPGHRDRHARMPTHDTRQVLHRLQPGHALEEGQGRQQIGRRAQVDRQGRAGHHRRARLPAHRHRRARLLFQAGADSYETRSVISASNPESGRWGDVFGDGDMAAAVIDRIVHHGRILRFHGESYRNKHPS